MTLVHVSGSRTDATEQGKALWARAMTNAVRFGVPKQVLAVPELRARAAR